MTEGMDVNSVSPFTEEEEMFRHSVRGFLDRELEPNADKFIDNLEYQKAFWRKAGQAGLLGGAIPPEYGGPGASDVCGIVLSQELGRSIGGATIGTAIEADLATFLLVNGGTDAQKRKWAPGILSGEIIQSFLVSEPDAGSDAAAMRTTAVRDGDHYVVNGSKIYISNGNIASVLYLFAKTDPTKRGAGMSLFMVDANTPGISKVPMKTMGYAAYDLAQFFFDNVRIPAACILLGEGRAYELMLPIFALDRNEIAGRALGEAELAFKLTLEHVKQRKAFGRPLFELQDIQFKLAEIKTEIEVGRALLHESIRKIRAGHFKFSDGAMTKLWIPEMTGRVIDRCLQMFGGAGFMDDMPISKLYRANRLHRIYAGTSEMQKIAIARDL